jgi:hypothetical protein
MRVTHDMGARIEHSTHQREGMTMQNKHDQVTSIHWAACLLLLPLACSSPSPSAEADTELGTLELDLTAPDRAGRKYRLRDAHFLVTPQSGSLDGGPVSAILSSESAPDEERLTERLHPGSYTVQLQPGWRMEDVTAAPVDVPAILLSSDAVLFRIFRFSTSFVNYEFGVNGDPIAFGGDLSIGISIITADAGAR